ncbi:PucR family transcriptional regulator [Kribbella speibonae]|uniref:PucR family transcriptional regulator n=1 Tax=Kribbella speibonae TaxID=1572660 RepID=A0A4R0IYC8_9ACTN|nr:PucR family transcriptional regulator [Kribbella speibonae]TCC37674.1 PucR family transcriptional regulator [Kribbella speibonae]
MKGLLLRLSGLDTDAESAVRVIGFFDALVTGKADLNTLLRSTAALAECPVGIDAAGRGLVLRADPSGAIDVAGRPPGAQTRAAGDACFWVQRPAGGLALDEMVLERFALAGSILLDRTVDALPAVGDPALIELVVSASAGIAERSRALHLLGLAPSAPLQVAVTTHRPDGPSAQVGDQVVVLLPAGGMLEPASGARTGVGPAVPAIHAADSWRAARTALRLASPEDPIVHADDLGGLLILAERLRAEDIEASSDVLALDRIAAEPGGDDLLAILRAYCVTDSVRKAAALVYRHHSTVAYRLEHAASVLGFRIDNPNGRFRLSLALVMRALR